MSNREIVERFIEERKKRTVRFVIIQCVVDIAVAIAIGVIMTRALENGKSIVPHILVLVLVISSTLTSQIKVYFGSFQNFMWQTNIIRDYNAAKDSLAKAEKAAASGKSASTDLAEAQRNFDEAIDIIAEKIKADRQE